MSTLLRIIQIVISVLLMGLILLQNSKGGLSGGFGGGQQYRTKRGAEKMVFVLTIVFACIFLITSIVNVVLR